MRWSFAKAEPELAGKVAAEFGFSALLAQCLINRGYRELETIGPYVQPRLKQLSDPFLLPNMDLAVNRLLTALSDAEPLVIFGDYDVDGITATALLHLFFERIGLKASYYLPNRFEEGYGLTADAVENCLEKFPVKLMLAVDCGSTSWAVIETLRQKGIEVIVLDHHQVSDPIPPAVALVNPQLNATGKFHELCSAALAFKLAHAMTKRGRELSLAWSQEMDLREFLDLVALGTVADLVPLRGENRILVRAGLERLNSNPRPGVKALVQAAGIRGALTTYHIGFQLGPRLNAAGRLESALEALELLLTSDPTQAARIAGDLDRQNRERQSIEQRIVNEVVESLRSRFDPQNHFAIVEGSASWHIGVVGIVASRVLREFHRPTIIIGSDGGGEWRGSGRSISGFDLAGGLRACTELLVRHGGHAVAAGLSIVPEQISALRSKLNDVVRAAVRPEHLEPSLEMDCEVRLREITPRLAQEMETLEPVGLGNGRVQFAARNLCLKVPPRRFGTEDRHLKFWATDGDATLQALWWNCPKDWIFPARFDLAFEPQFDEENGAWLLELKVIDCRAS
jgi:single-stranded-DNA-specific exonuclease